VVGGGGGGIQWEVLEDNVARGYCGRHGEIMWGGGLRCVPNIRKGGGSGDWDIVYV
jgi:hypothetical protein